MLPDKAVFQTMDSPQLPFSRCQQEELLPGFRFPPTPATAQAAQREDEPGLAASSTMSPILCPKPSTHGSDICPGPSTIPCLAVYLLLLDGLSGISSSVVGPFWDMLTNPAGLNDFSLEPVIVMAFLTPGRFAVSLLFCLGFCRFRNKYSWISDIRFLLN